MFSILALSNNLLSLNQESQSENRWNSICLLIFNNGLMEGFLNFETMETSDTDQIFHFFNSQINKTCQIQFRYKNLCVKNREWQF